MLKLYWIKFLNVIRYQLFLIINFLLSRVKVENQPNTLLLVRLDSIGDYMLFRNFLKLLKESERFGIYRITLIGNILWKDIAENFDKAFIDDFIWIERDKFLNNPFYKYKILMRIRKSGFEMVIDPTYTRELLYGDTIIKASGAKERIGSSGALDKHTMWRRRLLTDRYFTKVIPASEENLFEFNRNIEFFEKLLNQEINTRHPFIDISFVEDEIEIKNNYIVVFPGAADENRRWGIKKFAEVSDYISLEFGYNIVIGGSYKENEIACEIIRLMKSKSVYNSTGKVTLSALAKIISSSKFLLTNETGAAHIAASVRKSFICISNGNHFGRFHPYPKEIFDKAYYIYPPEIMDTIDNYQILSEKYRFNSDLDINEIQPETVKEVIRKILK